jgi:hypothetical protein
MTAIQGNLCGRFFVFAVRVRMEPLCLVSVDAMRALHGQAHFREKCIVSECSVGVLLGEINDRVAINHC